jgi:hypothetical protein
MIKIFFKTSIAVLLFSNAVSAFASANEPTKPLLGLHIYNGYYGSKPEFSFNPYKDQLIRTRISDAVSANEISKVISRDFVAPEGNAYTYICVEFKTEVIAKRRMAELQKLDDSTGVQMGSDYTCGKLVRE